MKYNQGVLTSYKMKFSSYFQDTAQQFKKKKKTKYVYSALHTSLSEFILALKCGLLSIFKATSSLRSSTPDTMFCQSLMHNSLRVVNKSNTSPTACNYINIW